MTDWFRSWHGAPTDPKWLGIARRAGVAPGIVVAVVWSLMDRASQAEDRGSIAGYDAEGMACFFGCEPENVDAIVSAMTDRGMIVDGRFTNWRRYQPASDCSNRPAANVWSAIRANIFKRDDFTCRYCGARGVRLECDHVIPVSVGGSHEPNNLVTACFPCNRKKRDRTPEQMGWSI
jgi:hypothetical protein